MTIEYGLVQVLKVDLGTFTEATDVILDSNLNEFALLTDKCVRTFRQCSSTSLQNWAPTEESAVGTKSYFEEIRHFFLFSVVDTNVTGKYYSENVCMSNGSSQCGRLNIFGIERARPHMQLISNGYMGIGIGPAKGDQKNTMQ